MEKNFAIALHGGAQNRTKGEISPELELQYRAGLDEALLSAWDLLEQGHSALDAVETAVRSLEDNPLFNAGKGSALTFTGEIEMDASIMCGKSLRAGAVGAVKHVRNPVSLARAVMDNEKYTFLSGQGAEDIARKYNLELMPDEYFFTRERLQLWEESKQQITKYDTVGAVALDREGNLAAATSTGGLTGKLPGRIGDSPVIGSGTYANNECCAVSCTGEGDLMIRGVYAFNIFSLMKYRKMNLHNAVREVFFINSKQLNAEMGIIGVDKKGRIQLTTNTLPMFRAMKRNYENAFVGVWEK